MIMTSELEEQSIQTKDNIEQKWKFALSKELWLQLFQL